MFDSNLDLQKMSIDQIKGVRSDSMNKFGGKEDGKHDSKMPNEIANNKRQESIKLQAMNVDEDSSPMIDSLAHKVASKIYEKEELGL